MYLIGIYSFEWLLRVDLLLRGEERQPEHTQVGDLLILMLIAGCWYGMVMGTYCGIDPSHWRQMLYSAAKVPLLLTVTFWLSVPSFYVLNSLLGLRADFGRAMRAVIGAQAVLTLVLAALAPFTGFIYLSGCEYTHAILFNGLMFAIASGGGQVALRRSYRTLIARDWRHRWTLAAWLATYIFVGIQMGWVLRPFVGNPMLATTFLRSDALTNAYVSVAQIIYHALR